MTSNLLNHPHLFKIGLHLQAQSQGLDLKTSLRPSINMGTTCTVASSLSGATLLRHVFELRLTSFTGYRGLSLRLTNLLGHEATLTT